MRSTKRILTLAGLALATGAVLGMGATTATAATTQDSKVTVTQPGGPPDGDGRDRGGDGRDRGGDGRDGRNNGDWRDGRSHNRRDRVWTVGHFPTKRSCNWAGWVGQHNGSWDEYICVPTRRGYLLIVVDHGRRWR